MKPVIPLIRTSILLIGLISIGVINIGPHMPFYGFKDMQIGIIETRTTAHVRIAKDPTAQTAIPVVSENAGKDALTGMYVEVITDSSDLRAQQIIGVDVTSMPTLKVVGYTLLAFLILLPVEWWLGRKQRNLPSRPA